jgi:hypothetical protein
MLREFSHKIKRVFIGENLFSHKKEDKGKEFLLIQVSSVLLNVRNNYIYNFERKIVVVKTTRVFSTLLLKLQVC